MEESHKEDKTLKKVVENEETPLRKQYKEYMSAYLNCMDLFRIKIKEIEEKYVSKLHWNNFWKIFHITDIPVFAFIFLLLGLYAFFKDKTFNKKVILFLVLMALSIIINTLLVLKTKHRRNQIFTEMKLEESKLKVLYQDQGLNAVDKAAELVPELFLEKSLGKKYLKMKKTLSKEQFSAYHDELLNSVNNYIIKNKADSSSSAKALFYESWYQEHTYINREITHEERMLLSDMKDKMFHTKSKFDSEFINKE